MSVLNGEKTIWDRPLTRRAALATGIEAVIGGAAIAAVGCGDGTPKSLPTPPIPVETPTATQTSKEAPTPEPTPTTKIELPPIYDLAYKNEIQGPDITIIFGIEKTAYKKPVGTLGLSDKYLKQYAPDKYPNGMSQQEMTQRLNDGVLEGHLVHLHQKPQYKDLTLQQLKDLIHKGQAPEYIIPTGYQNDRIKIDTSKPVSFTVISHPGRTQLTTDISFDYNERDGGLVIGAYNQGGLSLGSRDPNHRESYYSALSIAEGLVMPAVRPLSGINDGTRFLTDAQTSASGILLYIMPYQVVGNSASIIAPGT